MEDEIEISLIQEVRIKSGHRCCICKCTARNVCLIYPQKAVKLSNLINLCDDCKDLFHGNPEKRKKMAMLKKHWWKLIKVTSKNGTSKKYVEVNSELKKYSILAENKIVLLVNSEDHLNSIKYGLVTHVIKMQQKYPDKLRGLELHIEDHRNKDGNFDEDISEILHNFIPNEMMIYITEINTPLYSYINPNEQINEIPPIDKWGIK